MTPGWTFLTNHAHLLLAVARAPDARVRDLAAAVGISERAALTIVADLESAGYLHRNRTGRRNTYVLHAGQPFRHPAAADHRVDELLAIFAEHDPHLDPLPASPHVGQAGDHDDAADTASTRS